MLKYEVSYRDKWTGNIDSFVIEDETVEGIVRVIVEKMVKNNWEFLYLNWHHNVEILNKLNSNCIRR